MFYEQLKKECKKQGLKMTPLIVECGISSGNIADWKKGGLPNGKILITLSKRLNVSTDYLLGLVD